jgi:Polyketide cyclase / dehydrase and lipid transport
MLAYILSGLVILVAVFLVVVAMRPAAFRIERSLVASAPPEQIFAHVEDFRRWAAWSPWEKMDPHMQKTFSGATSGPGASYAWLGNRKVGEGRMTIERATRPSEIRIELEFIKPWQATNLTTFSFEPTEAGTKVTWAMDGRNKFAAKAAGLFMDIDKLVGADFERGLAALKSLVETDRPAALRAAPGGGPTG